VVKYNVNSPRGSNKVGPLADQRKKNKQKQIKILLKMLHFLLQLHWKKKVESNKILASLPIRSGLTKELNKMATG